MIKPLEPGATIWLIAPARKVSREEMQPAIEFLQQHGFKVKEGKHLYSSFHQFAGTDLQRLEDFQHALEDENASAILFARGGYGTVRLIDQLDFSSFVKNPKWLIGFSDLTVVHSHIHKKFQLPTLHAPMAINFKQAEPAALRGLLSVITGRDYAVKAASHPLNRKGEAVAPVIGGNLSVLYSLLGSASEVSTEGKILFIEDLDEYLYHIDRMMMALKRAGKLEKLAGLITGAMTGMKDNAVPFGFTAEEIIQQCVAGYRYPVCFGFPSGHIPENMPLIFGTEARLTVGDAQTFLEFNHGRTS
jgi:muramoyltetrapeptide carboxypeptidase